MPNSKDREENVQSLMEGGWTRERAESYLEAIRDTFYWVISLNIYAQRVKQLLYYLEEDCLEPEELQLHLEVMWKDSWGEV